MWADLSKQSTDTICTVASIVARPHWLHIGAEVHGGAVVDVHSTERNKTKRCASLSETCPRNWTGKARKRWSSVRAPLAECQLTAWHGSSQQTRGAGLISPAGTTATEMAQWMSSRNAVTTSEATWHPSLTWKPNMKCTKKKTCAKVHVHERQKQCPFVSRYG